MKIDILTLFPNMFDEFISSSIIKRAIDNKKVSINIINFRNFSKLPNEQVDDTPYGGGAGMVLMCQPIFDAIESLKTKDSYVIMMSPRGKLFKQNYAVSLSKKKHLIILCGHYEGFDERIRNIIDLELSIGDYVLTGGEIPAMAITDAVTRLIPGVINAESLKNESFNDNLLDYPVYTKPADFRGLKVPEVLQNGNHKKINEYREIKRKEITKQNRPDLLD